MHARFFIANHWVLPKVRSEMRIVTQPLWSGDKCYAHRRRHFDRLARGRQIAGGGIDVEDDNVVGLLIFRKKICARGVDGEMARRFAASQDLPERLQRSLLFVDREN